MLCGDVEPHPGPTVEDSVKRLETKVDQQAARIEEKLNRLIETTETVHTRSKELDQKFQSLENSVIKNCTEIKGRIGSLEEAIRENNERLERMEEDQEEIVSRVQRLEEELERQERYSRRSNILLYGLKEETGESFDRCASKVVEILRHYFPQKHWLEADIERAHRLGSSSLSSDRPRPMIIKFQRWGDAMIVMRDRDAKNQMRMKGGFRVATDLTRQQRDTVARYREQGKHAFFAKGKLVVQDFRTHPGHQMGLNQDSLSAVSYAQKVAGTPENQPSTSQSVDEETVLDPSDERHPSDEQPSSHTPDHLDSLATPSVATPSQQRPSPGTAPGFGRGSPRLSGQHGSVHNSGRRDETGARGTVNSSGGRDGNGGRGRGKVNRTKKTLSQSSPAMTRAHSTSQQRTLPSDWNVGTSKSVHTDSKKKTGNQKAGNNR